MRLKLARFRRPEFPTPAEGRWERPRPKPIDGPTSMSEDFLTAAEAARRLGITTTTFYDWVGKSRIGELEIRGRRVTIEFFQGGARGQGRIRLEAGEVERLRELMRVRSQTVAVRPPPVKQTHFPGIYVPLGRPR